MPDVSKAASPAPNWTMEGVPKCLQKSKLARNPKIVAVDTLAPAGSTICKSNVTRLAGVMAML
jgi:hypothetical protein